jgi:membrane-associated phospholipid phosphatase
MISVQQGPEFSKKIATLISILANAPLVSIPVFIVINYVVSGAMFIQFTLVSIFFAGIIPVLTLLLWSRKIKKTAFDIPEKENRPIPLVFAIISYFVGTIILDFLHAPWLVLALMFCYCTNTLIVFVITFFWKISIHSMGITGPATALVFAIGLPGFIFGILVLPVMWSRVYLHRHSIAQVLAGACLGVLLTGMQLVLIRAKI